MTSASQEFRVGLFTLLGLVLLCVLVLLYGEEPRWFWTTRWKLEILADTPRGIGEGTPAFLQGVQVGRVDHIELKDAMLPSVGAAVVVEIDELYDIPEGSRATLHPSFGFDKGAIHLHPPAVPSGPLAREGASIEGETVGPLDAVVPQEFVEQLVVAVEQIGKVGAVADQLVFLLEPRDMRDVDAQESTLMANLSTAIQRLDHTLREFNTLIGDSEDGEIRALLAHLRETSGHLAQWAGTLDERTERLVERVDGTLRTMESRVDDVGQRMANATDRLSRVADQLNAITTAVNVGEGTAGRMVRDPRLYEELVDAVQSLKLTLEDFRALATWIETDSWLKRGL